MAKQELIIDGDIVKNIDIEGIKKILPHRPPFLLVDRVLEVVKYQSAVGIKNVTMNEEFFRGHFPTEPVMPGVLIIEALAQVGGVMAIVSMDNPLDPNNQSKASQKMYYFIGIDNVKFRRKVIPGDSLILKVKRTQGRGAVWKMRGEAFVGDELATEADFTTMSVDNPA